MALALSIEIVLGDCRPLTTTNGQLNKAQQSFGEDVLDYKLRRGHSKVPRFQWQQ